MSKRLWVLAAPLVFVVGGCADDTTVSDTMRSSLTSTTARSVDSTTTSQLVVSTTTAETTTSAIASMRFEVAHAGESTTCATEVELRWSHDPDHILGSVSGDTVLQIVGMLGSDGVAVLSLCKENLLVSIGVGTRESFTFGEPYLAPEGSTDRMRFRWFEDPLILEARKGVPEFVHVEVELPTNQSTTLSLDLSEGLVGTSCGEPHLEVGVYATDGTGDRRPWMVDGVQLATTWGQGDFVANASGDFAIVEPVCTDDGSWSELVLGRFDTETGDLLDYVRLPGFVRIDSVMNHWGPTGVAVAEGGELVVEVGADLVIPLTSEELCGATEPLPGEEDWTRYVGAGDQIRPQQHLCEDGRLIDTRDPQIGDSVTSTR